MDEFITGLSPDYQLDNYRIKDDMIVFEISSKRKEVRCPYCSKLSSRVHSYYQREVQDLPMQNKKVVLLVKTRKMFCDNKECEKKTFSEQHDFVGIKGKKTTRLEKRIIYTATQLSSINASKILKADAIDTCKSSICNLLKKNAGNCG